MLKKVLVLLMIFIALSSVAFADLTASEENPTLDIDYSDYDRDTEDEVELDTVYFTIQNTGASSEDVTLTLSGFENGFSAEFDSGDESFTLAADESREIGVTFTIDLTEGINGGELSSVATVKANSEELVVFDADVKNMLLIDNILFEVERQDEFDFDEGDDGGDVDVRVTPGDEVVVTFSFENLFDKDYREGDISVEVKLEMDEDDFGDEIDEEIDFDIDAGDDISDSDDSYALSFTVPEDADEDEYDLEISIDAEDENGAQYNFDLVAVIEVERERDDVRLTQVSLSPNTVQCGAAFTLDVEISNVGSNDQDEAAIEIRNTDLGISARENLALDQGSNSRSTQTVRFNLDVPEDVDAGEYTLEVRGLIDYTVLVDRELVELNVECEEASTTTTTTTTTTTSTPDEPETTATTGGQESEGTVATVEKHYTLEDVAVSLLVVFIALIAVAVVLLIILGTMPRRRR